MPSPAMDQPCVALFPVPLPRPFHLPIAHLTKPRGLDQLSTPPWTRLNNSNRFRSFALNFSTNIPLSSGGLHSDISIEPARGHFHRVSSDMNLLNTWKKRSNLSANRMRLCCRRGAPQQAEIGRVAEYPCELDFYGADWPSLCCRLEEPHAARHERV